MGKVIVFYLLWRITGNPIEAIFVLLVIFYFLDRRFVGIFPSVMKPFRLAGRIGRLRQELRLNPHHTGNKQELARIFIEKGQYSKALPLIQEVYERVPESPEVQYELGLCLLKSGRMNDGEQLILSTLQENPMLRYGEPYLELADVFRKENVEKALHYVSLVREINASSVETCYRLGNLLLDLNRRQEAGSAFQEALEIYRSLPRYMRRKQRKWAVLSWFKGLFTGS